MPSTYAEGPQSNPWWKNGRYQHRKWADVPLGVYVENTIRMILADQETAIDEVVALRGLDPTLLGLFAEDAMYAGQICDPMGRFLFVEAEYHDGSEGHNYRDDRVQLLVYVDPAQADDPSTGWKIAEYYLHAFKNLLTAAYPQEFVWRAQEVGEEPTLYAFELQRRPQVTRSDATVRVGRALAATNEIVVQALLQISLTVRVPRVLFNQQS